MPCVSLHQNTQVRTLLVSECVRPDKKTAAEVIVLCGSFIYFASGIRSRNAAAVSKSQPNAAKAL